MQQYPKLIFINGPAGIGKSTIAQKYIDDHPFALCVNSDDLIASIGQWLTHEDEARDLAFELVKSMVATHLRSGHDVIVPHLLTDLDEVDALEAIAKDLHAALFEFALVADKAEAIARMHERGTWGEPGSPPLTQADTPIIEDLFDRSMAAVGKRPNTIKITSVRGDIEGTYAKLQSALAASQTPAA